jgi:hypothetical protein
MMLRITALILVVATGVHTASLDAQSPALFTFHSNPWINLHHLLLAAEQTPPELPEADRTQWTSALEFYRRYARRSPLFDRELVDVKNALRTAEGKTTLDGLTIDAELRATLERVMAVYQKHWWAAHDRGNRDWIAAVRPLLDRHGAALSLAVARAYGTTWPAEPVPVDVAVKAGSLGAYTAIGPTHVVISSADPSYQGHAALEMLFHEASHAWDEVLSNGIPQAAKLQGVSIPSQLWHAVLFYTAGELTARELRTQGVSDYVGYMQKQNLRMCDAGCLAKIADSWAPHLDGQRSVSEAIAGLVASFK